MNSAEGFALYSFLQCTWKSGICSEKCLSTDVMCKTSGSTNDAYESVPFVCRKTSRSQTTSIL